jgi:HD-GYP domain-containing protein (c-di-GMP phosphodiesterase class II)
MTSDRSYRKALSPEEAVRELERCAGTQFDPAVVAALASLANGDDRAVPTGTTNAPAAQLRAATPAG